MRLIADLKDLLLPRLCPVCGKLLMESEDVLCAFCAIGLPRYSVSNSNSPSNSADGLPSRQRDTASSKVSMPLSLCRCIGGDAWDAAITRLRCWHWAWQR